MVDARQALQPGWGPFWQVVSAMSDREPFTEEVARVLRAAGFYGPRTVSRPPEALKMTLEQLVAAQGPSHLGGLLRPVPIMMDAQASSQDQRWQSQLRPDLRRAAPEIYMNFRSEGVANTREWIAREFEHQKGSDLYADFWHLATEVDFMLDRCLSEQEKLALLASEDTLELKLRRLASKVHEMRTGDKDAALHMLAITVPGRKRDVAPGWMIADAQTHSKNFHQQHERVTKRGGGGGSSYAGGRGGGQPAGGGSSPHGKGGGKGDGKKGDKGDRGGKPGRRGGRGGGK